MTQKWIAARTNTMEAWVDHRRTGYSKLPYIYENNSSVEQGVIGPNEFLRRVIFTNGQKANNAAAVAAYFHYGFTISDDIIIDIGSGFVMDDYLMTMTIK